MLSKQFNLRSFSKLSHSSNLKPWFVTGLIDAEGSFTVLVIKDIRRKLGWRIECKFQLGLHERDLSLLLQIQVFLGGIGKLYKSPEFVNYIISSNSDLLILINHLKIYPLLTQKGGDFVLFKKVVELINNKAHLNIKGLHQIVNIKASINLGLSKQLKSEFKQFSPVIRPIINTDIIPNPNWISGFTSGEGNFSIKIFKGKTKTGYRVQLKFRLVQHSRDRKLMEILNKYFHSGNVYNYSEKSAVVLEIFNFSDIYNVLLPFFDKYPIIGVKQLDYLDWCKVAKLMSEGFHLTDNGLSLIRKIKEGMNRERSKK
jgi:hypothetical protein